MQQIFSFYFARMFLTKLIIKPHSIKVFVCLVYFFLLILFDVEPSANSVSHSKFRSYDASFFQDDWKRNSWPSAFCIVV